MRKVAYSIVQNSCFSPEFMLYLSNIETNLYDSYGLNNHKTEKRTGYDNNDKKQGKAYTTGFPGLYFSSINTYFCGA